jgi:hypothetical protein
MSDYAAGKVEGEEAPELAKEILYSQGAFSLFSASFEAA